MNRICVICARGGSKGIKNKNLRTLAGKPLIQHSIDQAIESGIFAAIAISSDSDAILEAAANLGVEYLVKRPANLASDTAPKIPAIRHCAETIENLADLKFDTIVDLDVTSPLRIDIDIKGAVDLLENSSTYNVVSGAPARRSPYYNLVELDQAGHVRVSKPLDQEIFRRQDSPYCYDLNASVFVWTREGLFSRGNSVYQKETLLYEMPADRSIDIDSEVDLKFVEFLLTQKM
jgi:CMP-N,N'-diacetyllegionaminic acid synthase